MVCSDDREVPTYYANFVTMNINSEEFVMEFRALLQSHKEMWESTSKPTTPAPSIPVPPLSQEEIYSIRPVARVVIAIPSARAIRDYLNQTLKTIAIQRKAQPE